MLATPSTCAAARCSSSRIVISEVEVGAGIPRPLRPVGADEEVHLRPRVGPLGQRRAAPELDVVGMGPDREHPIGGRQVDPQTHVSSSFRERREIGGVVDVEAQRVVVHQAHLEAAAFGLRDVAGTRSGAVRERELGGRRDGEHRRAVIVLVGTTTAIARSPSSAKPSSVDASGRSACITTTRASPCARTHSRPWSAAASSDPGSSMWARPSARAHVDHVGCARHDHGRSWPGRGATTRSAIVRLNARRASSSSASARRALPSANDRNGTTTPAVSDERRADMACVCYRSWTLCTPWPRACSSPGCGGACTGRSKARRTSRRRVRRSSRATTSRTSTR